MRLDSARNRIFWGCTGRKDWLFGVDIRQLGDVEVPGLPPVPPDKARVYEEKDVFKRGSRGRLGKL